MVGVVEEGYGRVKMRVGKGQYRVRIRLDLGWNRVKIGSKYIG